MKKVLFLFCFILKGTSVPLHHHWHVHLLRGAITDFAFSTFKLSANTFSAASAASLNTMEAASSAVTAPFHASFAASAGARNEIASSHSRTCSCIASGKMFELFRNIIAREDDSHSAFRACSAASSFSVCAVSVAILAALRAFRASISVISTAIFAILIPSFVSDVLTLESFPRSILQVHEKSLFCFVFLFSFL